MRIVLIFNPASGGGAAGRLMRAATVADALAGLGHAVDLVETKGAGSAGAQAMEAARAGAGVVFACGGDGTVHEVMQGLVGSASAALGIVPMGSANALARHLGLSLDPVEAALQQMRGSAALVSVGRVEYDGGQRYFTVMAGAGPDGALVYDLDAELKAEWGRFAYYRHALRLFITRRFRPFAVEYIKADAGQTVSERAVCAMAVRVGSLGGVFAGIARRAASSEDPDLRLVLVRPPALISLPVWLVAGWLRLERINPLARFVTVREFSCLPPNGSPAHVEADGEWLGRLPMRVSVVPDALRILRPRRDLNAR